MKLKLYTGSEVREPRQKLRMNQADFWAHFHTTQSGGSRYESGREIPRPVQALLNIVFGADAKSVGIVTDLREFGRPKEKPKVAQGEAE